jgi:hypothetical protein
MMLIGTLSSYKGPQPAQISTLETVPQSTEGTPVPALAPNSTGTVVQRFWVMVNVQLPLGTPGHVEIPGVIIGAPQHTVVVTPGIAKGVTVTGTHIDEA